MINIALLGSTGSIGVQALEVVARRPDLFRIVSLAAGSNSALFYDQVEKFRPQTASLAAGVAEEFARAHEDVNFFSGDDAYLDAVVAEADIVLVALVGFIGVKAVLKAIELGKKIALANKESLVVGGEIVTAAARKNGVSLIPVDSEHSAIWQALNMDANAEFDKLIITASGGAFRDVPLDKLGEMTAADALRHPTWSMGRRITVDCATMINKGFEVIEAMWLFGASLDRIEVLIHRESIVHSLVGFKDGAVIAQLGVPSMELPIQLALAGERIPSAARLDLAAVGKLTFAAVDRKRYPCFALALECAAQGGNLPCVLNAADEVAVDAFLRGKIKFNDIYTVLARTVHSCGPKTISSLSDLEREDAWARGATERAIGELNADFTE